MLEALQRKHREAPAFIKQYESKQRTVAAQVHVYTHSTCKVEQDYLAGWISVNKQWLVANYEKYTQALKMISIPESMLAEIGDLINLKESIENEH